MTSPSASLWSDDPLGQPSTTGWGSSPVHLSSPLHPPLSSGCSPPFDFSIFEPNSSTSTSQLSSIPSNQPSIDQAITFSDVVVGKTSNEQQPIKSSLPSCYPPCQAKTEDKLLPTTSSFSSSSSSLPPPTQLSQHPPQRSTHQPAVPSPSSTSASTTNQLRTNEKIDYEQLKLEKDLPPVEISNVMCTFKTGCYLNLRLVASRMKDVRHRRDKGLTEVRFRRPKAVCQIRSSGKIVLTGCETEEQSHRAVRKLARKLQHLNYPVKILDYRINNVFCSGSCGFEVDLEAFFRSVKMPLVMYNSEIHGSLEYHPHGYDWLAPGETVSADVDPTTIRSPKSLRVMLRSTGSMTATGPSLQLVRRGIHECYLKAIHFRKYRNQDNYAELEYIESVRREKRRQRRRRKGNAQSDVVRAKKRKRTSSVSSSSSASSSSLPSSPGGGRDAAAGGGDDDDDDDDDDDNDGDSDDDIGTSDLCDDGSSEDGELLAEQDVGREKADTFDVPKMLVNRVETELRQTTAASTRYQAPRIYGLQPVSGEYLLNKTSLPIGKQLAGQGLVSNVRRTVQFSNLSASDVGRIRPVLVKPVRARLPPPTPNEMFAPRLPPANYSLPVSFRGVPVVPVRVPSMPGKVNRGGDEEYVEEALAD